MKSLKTKMVLVVLVLALLAVIPVSAQTMPAPTTDTITVTGFGDAFGTPDRASIDIGVEVLNNDIAVAFEEANATIDRIISAMVEAGVAREDIRTVNLNVYLDRFGGGMPMPMDGSAPTPTYNVNNMVNVVVRDITLVDEVITAAVEAGATSIFGLNFTIADRADLEADAREEAVNDANERAAALAELVGAELGDVVNVVEVTGGFGYPIPYAMDSAMGLGGGGATIEPGQLSVSMQVQVTYAINR
ncbi:MAG: SIMPL domain-containing protein [Anaerolineae bacterium]